MILEKRSGVTLICSAESRTCPSGVAAYEAFDIETLAEAFADEYSVRVRFLFAKSSVIGWPVVTFIVTDEFEVLPGGVVVVGGTVDGSVV